MPSVQRLLKGSLSLKESLIKAGSSGECFVCDLSDFAATTTDAFVVLEITGRRCHQ
jgi:hypothetical protein